VQEQIYKNKGTQKR